MEALLISLGAFICVASLIGLLSGAVSQRNDPLHRRLMASVAAPGAAAAEDESKGWLADLSESVLGRFGITSWHTPGVRTFGQRISLFITLIVLGFASSFAVGKGMTMLDLGPLFVVAGMALGGWMGAMLTVRYWMHRHTSRWMEEINNGIIDVIDLWVLCLGAGMSFAAALVRVAQDEELTPPALREELQLTNQEMLAGASREDALRHLVRRCGDSADLRALVSHIIQSERLGSSLTDTLQVYSQTLRFKRTQDTKEMIQTLPLKLTFPLIFCILPALFVVILGPSVIRLFEVLGGK